MINQKSIAVLPFVNMSSHIDNEYFCDGITEEIINALTKVKGLKVTSRTSSFAFKNKNIDVRHIGNELGVATVLEGSIRIFKKKIRITAQLIRTTDGFHIWSQNFDRNLEDVFELQDEISLCIANLIRENFGHLEIQKHLVNEPTNNINAYQLFLRGRSLQLKWTAENIKLAISYYNKAIALDKNYAKAYYANLQCYGLLAMWGDMPYKEAMDLALNNFLIAKEIDTTLPEYPLSFVGKSFWGEWDFKNAYGHINQVLEINPNHTDGLEAMSELFMALGFFDYATMYANKLLAVDPLSANNHYTLAHIYYYQKKFNKALESINYALYLNPELELAHHLQCYCYIWLNRQKEFEDAIIAKPNNYEKTLLFQVINNKDTTIPVAFLEECSNNNITENNLAPYNLYILANSKHKELAFSMLQDKVNQKRGQIINFRQEPFLIPLRKLKGFSQLHQSNLLLSDIKLSMHNDKTKTNTLDAEQLKVLKEKLIAYFEDEKPYLNPKLNLISLAEALQLNPNKISYLINESFGVNFNDYINKFRLLHFKSMALNPKFKHLTILGLAYDSGFNSKTVFNTFFKKETGMTPSKWVKSQN
ncbi:helix-turn-helix domain-containing protein [Lacinutrix iliipiscaria]|uniref:Helix-turn-helix domain-containing protein n=1 Tax=Lacinutrix iliipiscaria TaxID=1230532 RepID=A0ABW5WM49_9FLAO